MEGLEAEVALIVKAPNQQTDDIKIRAGSAWSVRQLKAHLAEVYPSKPKTDDQKIIYSGRLLEDSALLRDVLRTYEGQEAHTMHLVCATERRAGAEAEGLRRRTVAEGAEQEPPRAEARQNDQNHTAEGNLFAHGPRVPPPYPQYAPLGYAPGDPAAMADHYAMMQAYMQYMQQYANMWQSASGNAPGVQPVNVANDPAPQPAAAQPPAEGAEDEAEAPRDWLDWLYATSRLAVLFSLLYFYSSPFRLLLVMVLAVLGYLYQLGFFREVEQRQMEQPQNERARPDNQPNDVRPDDDANGTENAETIPDANANVASTENSNQSYLAATWMIFTSFFTSLIPDTPNVV